MTPDKALSVFGDACMCSLGQITLSNTVVVVDMAVVVVMMLNKTGRTKLVFSQKLTVLEELTTSIVTNLTPSQ